MSNAAVGTPTPDVMRELRIQMLTAPAAKFGIEPTPDYPRVYGIVMDWPIGEDIATVVSLCDGSASLYTTSTFGVIGGIGHESVRREACVFVKAAANFVTVSSPTSEFPYPESNRVRYYLLTFDGVKVIDAALRAVTEGGHKSAELFAHGQAVLAELRLVTENDSGNDGTDKTSRREWSGPPGYVNCLLTAMSEGILRSVDLLASKPVPNLVDLAADHEDMREWIKAQNFPYGSLNAKEVIRVLKQSAKIRGLPFLTNHGDLPTIHAQDDGTGIARVFDISIGPLNRWARIELAPESDPRVVALQREADTRNAS